MAFYSLNTNNGFYPKSKKIHVVVDVSEDGKIVGIEILNAKKNLGEALINKQEAKNTPTHISIYF